MTIEQVDKDALAVWLGLTVIALTVIVITALIALDVWLWRKAVGV